MNRRKVIKHGLIFAAAALAGCSGDEGAAPIVGANGPPPVAPSSSAWNPSVPPLLVKSSASFDLAATLPLGVIKGGKFAIDASGAALPVGMLLTSAGILSVGTAAVGTVSGVIFTYETP